MLDHTTKNVTARYIIFDPEVYRKEVEAIGMVLTQAMGIDQVMVEAVDMPRITMIEEKRTQTKLKNVSLVQAWLDFRWSSKFDRDKEEMWESTFEKAFKPYQKKWIQNIRPFWIERHHKALTHEHGVTFGDLALVILNDVLEFAVHEYVDGKGKPVLAVNPAAAVLAERSEQFTRLAASLGFDKAKTNEEVRFIADTVCRLVRR